jgi:hypothetical protein
MCHHCPISLWMTIRPAILIHGITMTPRCKIPLCCHMMRMQANQFITHSPMIMVSTTRTKVDPTGKHSRGTSQECHKLTNVSMGATRVPGGLQTTTVRLMPLTRNPLTGTMGRRWQECLDPIFPTKIYQKTSAQDGGRVQAQEPISVSRRSVELANGAAMSRKLSYNSSMSIMSRMSSRMISNTNNSHHISSILTARPHRALSGIYRIQCPSDKAPLDSSLITARQVLMAPK